jgi:hypothetical protein
MSRVELWKRRGEETRSITTTHPAEFIIKSHSDYLYLLLQDALCASVRFGSEVHRGKVSGQVALHA